MGTRRRIALGGALLALPLAVFGVGGAYGSPAAPICPPSISGCPGFGPQPDPSTFPGPVDFGPGAAPAQFDFGAAPTATGRTYSVSFSVAPGASTDAACEGSVGNRDSLTNVFPAVPGPYSLVGYSFLTDTGRQVGLHVTNSGPAVFQGSITCVDDKA